MEVFDVIGGFRTRYRSQELGDPATARLHRRAIWEYKLGPSVDASGTMSNGESFQDIQQFKSLLMQQRDQVARNVAHQLVMFATGAAISFADRPVIESILERSREQHYGMRTLIHEIVQSPLFLRK